MRARWFAGILGAVLMVAPLCAADQAKRESESKKSQESDMQRAIAFEHYKDVAAARQARKEARHPTVFYNNNADRADQNQMPGRPVKPSK